MVLLIFFSLIEKNSIHHFSMIYIKITFTHFYIEQLSPL
ncbi:hypothetical protein FM106_11655 [Brachybacterium faecium]|nr:hypothetical protein FM106_11655 [Brachybacterium faecium]